MSADICFPFGFYNVNPANRAYDPAVHGTCTKCLAQHVSHSVVMEVSAEGVDIFSYCPKCGLRRCMLTANIIQHARPAVQSPEPTKKDIGDILETF